jgi:hypothetical protein
MMDRPERAVARLWHVAEYRGTGIVSRLALALERVNYPHVSSRLTGIEIVTIVVISSKLEIVLKCIIG